MFVIGNLIAALVEVINWVLWAYFWIIIARVVISWVNADRFNPIVQFIYRATEPVLRPIRRRLPDMPLDFSPMIVIIVIYVLQRFLVTTLDQLAYSFR